MLLRWMGGSLRSGLRAGTQFDKCCIFYIMKFWRIADIRCARKLNWEIEESGRSGLRSSFFDVQTQLTAAVSPLCKFDFPLRALAVWIMLKPQKSRCRNAA